MENVDPKVREQITNNRLFDFYRIVDVDTYAVYDWQDGKTIDANMRCYEVWKRGDACNNCISRTCILEKRPIIKLEYFEGQIFLIVAFPITLDNKLFSLELICNATNSLVINDTFHVQNLNAQEIIGRMNDIAVHDSYTGLYNKRYAEQELCKAVLEWTSESRLFIGVLDIDHFKQINDTYGHVEGDEVLRVLAQLLTEYAARAHGWASRIGGDEFMILWNGLSPHAARELAKELQDRVRAHSFTKKDERFTVSVSIGLAEYRPEFTCWKEFLDAADQEMYRNKKQSYDQG